MLRSVATMAVKCRCLPQSKYISNRLKHVNWEYNYSKADACDVINYEEYEDVANKVLQKKPTRAITIFVDMKDIEKNGSADSEDGSDDDNEADVSNTY